jgi:hypothetical protein
LTNWICQVPNINAALDVFPDGVGYPIDLARGALRWQMAVPPNGRLPFDNLFPALIQWHGDLHPARMLVQSGCRLRRLVVSHPEGLELAKLLGQMEGVVFDTGAAALRAEFETPHGPRVLE